MTMRYRGGGHKRRYRDRLRATAHGGDRVDGRVRSKPFEQHLPCRVQGR